jgi:ATP-dependent Clp protease ATP-binding subunit ClpC
MKEIVLEELKKKFRPEFLNRVDESVVFRPLTKEDLAVILDIMLADLNKRLEEKGLLVVPSKKVKAFLVAKSYDPKFGARPLRRILEEHLENPLSEEVLKSKFTYGMEIKADFRDEQIVFTGKMRKLDEKDVIKPKVKRTKLPATAK